MPLVIVLIILIIAPFRNVDGEFTIRFIDFFSPVPTLYSKGEVEAIVESDGLISRVEIWQFHIGHLIALFVDQDV